MRTQAPAEVGLKITVQYRTKHGRCYELMNGAALLVVHISPPETERASGDCSWHVEARSGSDTNGPSVDAWGVTAAAALCEVARTCASRVPSLAAFNWETVARELQSVHAV